MSLFLVGFESIVLVDTYTPESNMDTKNGHISKEPPFPNHHCGPHVSFRGVRLCLRDQSFSAPCRDVCKKNSP